jgi:hypothetical protein
VLPFHACSRNIGPSAPFCNSGCFPLYAHITIIHHDISITSPIAVAIADTLQLQRRHSSSQHQHRHQDQHAPDFFLVAPLLPAPRPRCLPLDWMPAAVAGRSQ